MLNHLLGRFHDRGILKNTRGSLQLRRVARAIGIFSLESLTQASFSGVTILTISLLFPPDENNNVTCLCWWQFEMLSYLPLALQQRSISRNMKELAVARSPVVPRADRAYRALSLNFPIVARNDRSYPSIDRCRRSSKRDSFSRGSYVSSRERNE